MRHRSAASFGLGAPVGPTIQRNFAAHIDIHRKLEPEGLKALGSWLGELRSIYQENYARLDEVLNKLKTPTERPKP